MAEFKVLTWNMGGAKYFSELKDRPTAKTWNQHVGKAVRVLRALLKKYNPDVVALQEVPKAEGARGFKNVLDEIQIEEEEEVNCSAVFFENLRSDTHQIRKVFSDLAQVPRFRNVHFLQGYAFLYMSDPSLAVPRSVWTEHMPLADHPPEEAFEGIHLSTGLYCGDRNTEPRLAVMGRFFKTFGKKQKDPALEVCVLNLHLSTLRYERENMPGFDMESANVRRSQIDTLLKYVITPYNLAIRDKWQAGWNEMSGGPVGQDEEQGLRQRTPLWFLAGDLNCPPNSQEIQFLEQMNFEDLVPSDPPVRGTKMDSSHAHPTLVLDYIFAGPSFTLEGNAFKPTKNSEVVDIENLPASPPWTFSTFPSDHIPVFAELKSDDETPNRALDTVGTRKLILDALGR